MSNPNHTAPHSRLRQAITDRLRSLGAYVYCSGPGLYGRKGAPDVFACLGGRFIGCEAKTGAGELTPDQRRELDRIRRAGGLAIEARSVADVDSALAAAGLVAPPLLAMEV